MKAATLIMGDDRGISPSNVEHGYVVRRLIRKSIRQGRQLNIQGQFLARIAEIVIDMYKDIYPELDRNRSFVLDGLTKEEKNFSKALNRGLKRFRQIFDQKGTITGEDAFLLFTSFGFPVEMRVFSEFFDAFDWEQVTCYTLRHR